MKKYDAARAELATRDLVSKAIATEIREGRGLGPKGHEYVELELRHLGRETIRAKLPHLRELATKLQKIDPVEARLPVRPTCHYFMGGIDVGSFYTGGTAIAGVFAAGECACVSVHGANRLGGNSLADCIVFGKFAGRGAATYAAGNDFNVSSLSGAAQNWSEKYDTLVDRSGNADFYSIRHRLAQTMWDNAGIFRNGRGLNKAQAAVDELWEEYGSCAIGDNNRLYNTSFVQYVELGNMLTVAKAIVLGALAREESRGAHLREDFPERNDRRYLRHTLVAITGTEYKLAYCPVVITRLPPERGKIDAPDHLPDHAI